MIKITAQIARQAKVVKKKYSKSVIDDHEDNMATVFAGVGINLKTARFIKQDFEDSDRIENAVLFFNLQSDPPLQRLLTPRLAITTAEYLAFQAEKHVIVIMTDMSHYIDSIKDLYYGRLHKFSSHEP